MRSNEKGFILVTILLVIAVLFPLILAFNAKVQLNLIQAENFLNSVQALRIARSGVEGAKGILKADDPSYDARTDKWAAAFPSLALGDGILNVVVTDEDGKIPINNLVVAVSNNQATTGTNAAAGTTSATGATPAAGGTTPAGTTTPGAGGTTPATTTTPASGGTTPAAPTTPASGGATSATTTTSAAGDAAPAATTTTASGGTTSATTTTPSSGGTTPAGTATTASGGTTPAAPTTTGPGKTGSSATGDVTYQVDKNLDTRLRSLISQLGGKPEIVDALIDWLDPDNNTTGAEGAEDDYYKQRGYRCKNGPLDSLDELLLVKGFDKELLIDKNLKSYLTIAPTDGKVNLNTAPIQVLNAVLGTQTSGFAQPLSQSDIQDLVRYRDGHDLKNVTDMTLAVKIGQTQASAAAPLVKVNSDFFTVNSKYIIGNVVKNVEVLLKRSGTTVTTISWREF